MGAKHLLVLIRRRVNWCRNEKKKICSKKRLVDSVRVGCEAMMTRSESKSLNILPRGSGGCSFQTVAKCLEWDEHRHQSPSGISLLM